MDQWSVLIQEHPAGFIDWETFQAIQKRLDSNTRPGPHRKGGIVREGSALLPGIGMCGHRGRRLRTYYRGRNRTPGYHCAGKDEVIADLLNRQDRKTATGERFPANTAGSLRRYRDIPRFQPPAEPPGGEVVTIRKAAQILGRNTPSIHRGLADGFIQGEPVTPGAPRQIRITGQLRSRVVAQAPPEFLPLLEATMKLGVSRQTVLQRVKRGELEAVLVRQGRRKGVRIRVVAQPPTLFEQIS